MDDVKPKSRKGFASMDSQRVREISAMGGASVPAHLRSFAKSPGLAADAGRKGGLATGSKGFATMDPDKHSKLSRRAARSERSK